MTTLSWLEANKQYLMASIGLVQEALDRRATDGNNDGAAPSTPPMRSGAARQALRQAAGEMPAPSALDILCEIFSLSSFERDILLLCAGMELDASIACCCAKAQNDSRRAYPTFGLALAAFPDAHWSALTHGAPLRRWRLIEVGAGETLTTSPLRIDERILHYLAGVQETDERLAGIIEPFFGSAELVPSHCALAEQIARAWSRKSKNGTHPVIVLSGEERESKTMIAATACSAVGLNLCLMRALAVPAQPTELEALIRLWEREAALSSSALLVDAEELEASDAARSNAVSHLVERARTGLIMVCRERRSTQQRSMIALEVRSPSANEQRGLWRQALGGVVEGLNGTVDLLVSQFNMSGRTIQSAVAELKARLNAETSNGKQEAEDLKNTLWDICRAQTNPQHANLGQHIRSQASWDDLVLPELQKQILHETAVHVRQRMKVYETWGFRTKSSRGLGICALFAGASGTGKTLAAEVLANELRLDLYRIDLSQVVSKYIGETEKNLRRVFDAAEHGGSILLFDEADALFGKRSEVKDSHDRYANIEVSYLLQRMEAYRGLAILTTNMKGALDAAFLRRIRFIVQFPFPDASQRTEIWRRIFPGATPVNGLDVTKLARLNVAGGTIRNIALNAAFLAADAEEPVGMRHVLRATRGEYAKLEKTLSETEVGGWA